LGEVPERSRRAERSRWVSLSNPSNEWRGVPCLLYAPLQHQRPTAPSGHGLPFDARFPLQAFAYHASTVYQAGHCMPYSPRFTIQSSVYRIPLCLPCDARFPLQAAVYHVAICLPHTPLLTAPPLQALPQHPAALPALCITSHHTATSPLLHLKAYDVPAGLL